MALIDLCSQAFFTERVSRVVALHFKISLDWAAFHSGASRHEYCLITVYSHNISYSIITTALLFKVSTPVDSSGADLLIVELK